MQWSRVIPSFVYESTGVGVFEEMASLECCASLMARAQEAGAIKTTDLQVKSNHPSNVKALTRFTHVTTAKRLAVFCPLSIPALVAETEDSIVSQHTLSSHNHHHSSRAQPSPPSLTGQRNSEACAQAWNELILHTTLAVLNDF